MLLLSLIGQCKKWFNPTVPELLGNNFSPSPSQPSDLLHNFGRTRTWALVSGSDFTHYRHKISTASFIKHKWRKCFLSIKVSSQDTHFAIFQGYFGYLVGFLKEAQETIKLSNIEKKIKRLNQKLLLAQSLEFMITPNVWLQPSVLPRWQGCLKSAFTSVMLIQYKPTCHSFSECKRLDSQNIMQVWWRSNLRCQVWSARTEVSKEYQSLSYVWCLRAQCNCGYVARLLGFPCKGEKRNPYRKPHHCHLSMTSLCIKRKGQENHCSVINMHATRHSAPWQTAHCPGGGCHRPTFWADYKTDACKGYCK